MRTLNQVHAKNDFALKSVHGKIINIYTTFVKYILCFTKKNFKKIMSSATDKHSLALKAVKQLITYIGVDPEQPELQQTPARVLQAFAQIFAGYQQNPTQILSSTFAAPNQELVVLTNIAFSSTCEHHLLPFHGHCSIGYLPNNKIVGIGKLIQLLHCLAKRLQLQERLTQEIGSTLAKALNPLGVAVALTAQHSCLYCRGLADPKVKLKTQFFSGDFQQDFSLKQNFLALIH